MEIVKIIFSFISEHDVVGSIVLIIAIALIQHRKIKVKALEVEAIKDTNSTNLKIAREKHQTELKISKVERGKSPTSKSISKAS